MTLPDQNSGAVYERLLEGEVEVGEYVEALRREARGRVEAMLGCQLGHHVRAQRKVQIERDRFWQALVDIAGLENWQDRQARDIARNVLASDEQQAKP